MTDERVTWVEMEDDGFIGLVGPLSYRPFADDGSGLFKFQSVAKHRNRAGIVHGGMLMTFADRSLGYTARHRDPDRAQVTVQLDMHFMRSAPLGAEIFMNCRIVRETKALSFVSGEIYVDGQTIATAHGLWKKLRPRIKP